MKRDPKSSGTQMCWRCLPGWFPGVHPRARARRSPVGHVLGSADQGQDDTAQSRQRQARGFPGGLAAPAGRPLTATQVDEMQAAAASRH